MTGTDHTQLSDGVKAPVVILANPQMGENIGATARAMLNCGLTELRLINPRDGWPNERADAMSSGALSQMTPVQVFDTMKEAIADCHFVLATTARPRDMVKPVFNGEGAAQETVKRINEGQRVAFLFGGERSGLDNEDIALSHAVVTIPLNPGFSSLNLGQAVLLLSYEWSKTQYEAPPRELVTGDSAPARHETLNEMLVRLENELAAHHFFRSPPMRPSIMRNLKTMLVRADMTEQEVRTFHGIISALTGKKTPLKEK